jgi:hypothetical protein
MTTLSDRLPPSTAAIAIATALIAGITGYFLGQASTIGLFGSIRSPPPPSSSTRASKPSKSDPDSSSSSEDTDEALDSLQELQSFPGNTEECKLVLVVRTDLGMTKGLYQSTPLSTPPIPRQPLPDQFADSPLHNR